MSRLIDLGVAGGLLLSAASHGYLYVHGYQHIPVVLGFLERGWQPAPHAMLSIVAEALTAALCLIAVRKAKATPV